MITLQVGIQQFTIVEQATLYDHVCDGVSCSSDNYLLIANADQTDTR